MGFSEKDSQSGDKLTIDEVARLCGVSKTTVSRFLNGKYGNMSAQTREKIAREIDALGFRPNRSAQRLKSSRSMLVGCVIADISSPFSALLLKGITNVCEEHGYQVLFADSMESAARERRAIEGFLQNRVDGLIVNTCGGNDEYLLSLRQRGIPTVLADRELAGDAQMDTVTVPNFRAASDCTAYLFSQGYDNVAFFSEEIGSVSPRLLRQQGYASEAERRGKVPETFEFETGDVARCGEAIGEFLRRHPGQRNAILSSNGTSSQIIMLAANALGLEFGYRLGLCTFDNWSWLRLAKPGISAIALETDEIGARSASLLIERMSGELPDSVPPVHMSVGAELIERESTPGG